MSTKLTDSFVLGRPARHLGRKALIAALTAAFVWSSMASSPAPPTASASDPAIARLEGRIRNLDRRIRPHARTIRQLTRQARLLKKQKNDVRRDLLRARRRSQRGTGDSRSATRDSRDGGTLALHVRRVRLANRRAALVERRDVHRRVVARLRRERQRTEAELWRIRPIGYCPVRGPVSVSDDFGAARYVHGKYDHAHQGNDMMAAFGAPVVAPFDGRAAVASNHLGGISVKVFGAAGYVYNAHLSRLGKLGPVEAGDVVGYVGTTGNAQGTSPHNHFEWHPGGGAAVDPHDELLQVC